jgi:transcriptional regulator with GAF, ATPase, and Fis domain
MPPSGQTPGRLPARPDDSPSGVGEQGTRAAASLAELEREHILRVLASTGWRIRGKGAAADVLGLKPTTLEARMAKLGIHRPSSH